MHSRFSFTLLRRSFFLPLWLAIAGCGDGYVVGNGGDPALARFANARLNASEAMSYFTEERSGRVPADAEDVRYLLKHRREILAELQRIPIQLSGADHCTQKLHHHCSCTDSASGSPIFVQPLACNPAEPMSDLGELVLHETLHHFLGDDEASVTRLTAVVYELRRAFPSGVLPISFPVPEARSTTVLVSDGHSLLLGDATREGSLQRLAIRGEEVSASARIPMPFSGRNILGRLHRDGTVFFSPVRGMVQRVRIPHDPIREGTTVAASTADIFASVVVEPKPIMELVSAASTGWPNAQASYGPFLAVQVYFSSTQQVLLFDAGRELWRSLPAIPGGSQRFRSLVLTDRSLFALHGSKSDGSWRFDRKTEHWSPLPSADNFPVLGRAKIALGIPQGLFLYGETPQGAAGAIYEENENRWNPIAPGGPGAESGSLLGVVAFGEVHVLGDRWKRFSLRDREWEHGGSRTGSLLRRYRSIFRHEDGFVLWSPVNGGIYFPW